MGEGDADVVLDHQVSKAVTVEQDDLLGDRPGITAGGFGEIAGGDEYAFVGLLAGQGTDEALDLFQDTFLRQNYFTLPKQRPPRNLQPAT